ncbi:MAG TPA: hypothetical protein VLU91_05765 [Nitrososphaerales archaeon]|nr:hypothetical protein [Nitrososphaerales archaeon]
MKPIPTLVAAALVLALVLSPMVAFAAGSITFSSPTAGSSFKGTQSYTIAGTISPVPGQVDNVFISVKNAGGNTVDAAEVSANPTTGAFSYSTVTGGNSYWTTGTYSITAYDSYGATGSTSFTYTSPTSPTSYNVTQALVDIQGNLTQIKSELTALTAMQSTMQSDLKGNFTALSSALTSITNQLNTLTTNLGTVTTNLGTVQTDVTNMQGQLTTISNNITTLNSAVQAAQAAATAAQTAANNANSAVSSTQTYVLVVAVLAAITLVLELAILVRKLS